MFIPDKIYRRSELHDRYGGSRQNGISPSKKEPLIFIFTGSQGAKHGYFDGWLNEHVFTYTGEGQVGDMEFKRGNLSLRDHTISQLPVHLFEYVRKAEVKYVGQMEVIDFRYFSTHDRNNHLRQAIKFYMKRAGMVIDNLPDELQPLLDPRSRIREKPLPELTERMSQSKSRIGQDAFRTNLLHKWQYRCAVTGYNDSSILIASHIIPWKDSSDSERLDNDNGLLLSPLYDALFDKHLISFQDDGGIILSDRLKKYDLDVINVTGEELISGLSNGNKNYLKRHRLRLDDLDKESR